ncbi:1002_t:CDS:2 [Acaulospora morrowiae]|uniref:1002_t:CDS:1 n=1 Tax=Acaulospora morrowiae TaxID=94023 RepID=A0A9N9DCP1_9GLOM|nr:1002_t:CDS:2 [Acaulospora morrowiae]
MTEAEEAPQERQEDFNQAFQEHLNTLDQRNRRRTGLCGSLCIMCSSIILVIVLLGGSGVLLSQLI